LQRIWAGANLFILTPAEIRTLRRRLLDWYGAAKRDLPWRRTRDPWRILVSEVMLQQTRVAAVIPYYERFLEEFPDPGALAAAPEQKLLALWSGLGYYSRARNLQKAAQQIVGRAAGLRRAASPPNQQAIRFSGDRDRSDLENRQAPSLPHFPNTYEAIRALAGVGDYTAAAVASIAFQLPHAVLDGNVARVLARITAEEGDIKSAETRQRLAYAAARLLDPKAPGEHNQALMELGATLCLPRDPQCPLCPIARYCAARRCNRQLELPRKSARREPVRLERTLLLIRKNGAVLVRQRPARARLMPGFWELPESTDLPAAAPGALLGEFRHTITHHLYRCRVLEARLKGTPRGYRWIPDARLDELPLATTARKALEVAAASTRAQ
jgi:A/G-specific adenine glycosylase